MGGARLAVVDAGLDPPLLLARALDHLDVAGALADRAAALDVPLAELPVVVVPEVEAFVVGSPAATDPRLVEALVDLLHEAGCEDVACGFSADTTSRWAGNRDVYALADLLGYRFETPAGRPYDIIDLGEDLVPADFPDGGVLAGSPLARPWRDAGFRIVFASCRTDESDGYHLVLRTALRALPMVDDHLHYRVAASGGDVVHDLLARTPIDLALVDAVVSSDGSRGAAAPRPVHTHTIIASDDAWLADLAGAAKMGLDPGTSPLFRRAPADLGVDPEQLVGRLDAWPGFVRPDPAVLASTRARDATPTWPRLLRPWLQVLDHQTFPLLSPLDDRLNRRLAPVFAELDRDPVAMSLLVATNRVLAEVGTWVDTARTLADKDAVRRVRLPLGFDPADHAVEEFDAILPDLRRLAGVLSGTVERAPGLHWRRVDGATVFRYVRDLPVAFDEFVAAVDVTRTISLMNDYVGGVVVELAHDDHGRPVRQAERNRYLPQPNWVALWGGLPIDVGKLEVAEHGPDHHLLAWKTVTSANDSASHDDGIAEFRRAPGGTRITITGRQQFTLPPVLAALDLDLVPDLRDDLVTAAYRTFFDRTAANLEATAEGRDVRIGRPLPAVDEPATDLLPSAHLERAIEGLLDGLDVVDRYLQTGGPGRSGHHEPRDVERDDDGFTHVAGVTAGTGSGPPGGPGARTPGRTPARASAADDVARWWSGLVEAGLRDAEALGRAASR